MNLPDFDKVLQGIQSFIRYSAIRPIGLVLIFFHIIKWEYIHPKLQFFSAIPIAQLGDEKLQKLLEFYKINVLILPIVIISILLLLYLIDGFIIFSIKIFPVQIRPDSEQTIVLQLIPQDEIAETWLQFPKLQNFHELPLLISEKIKQLENNFTCAKTHIYQENEYHNLMFLIDYLCFLLGWILIASLFALQLNVPLLQTIARALSSLFIILILTYINTEKLVTDQKQIVRSKFYTLRHISYLTDLNPSPSNEEKDKILKLLERLKPIEKQYEVEQSFDPQLFKLTKKRNSYKSWIIIFVFGKPFNIPDYFTPKFLLYELWRKTQDNLIRPR